MRRAGVDLGRARLSQRRRAGDQRPAGEDHVVDHDRDFSLDVADHLGHLDGVVLGPRLVQDGEVGLEHLAEAPCELRPPYIRGDRDDLLAGQAPVAVVLREELEGRHVVDRDREEALDLARVQVHRDHAVDAGAL